ncbi:MAG: hypothetical protein WA970_18920 [Gammaproteobacteria bacterium]
MKTRYEGAFDPAEAEVDTTEDFDLSPDTWRLDDFEDLVDCRALEMRDFADSERGPVWVS